MDDDAYTAAKQSPLSEQPLPEEREPEEPEEPEEPLAEQQLNEAFEQLCESKADEFKLLGYEHITASDVWNCVSHKYSKRGYPPLYQIVNDILSLKVTTFMNWMTMSIYREDARF